MLQVIETPKHIFYIDLSFTSITRKSSSREACKKQYCRQKIFKVRKNLKAYQAPLCQQTSAALWPLAIPQQQHFSFAVHRSLYLVGSKLETPSSILFTKLKVVKVELMIPEAFPCWNLSIGTQIALPSQ